MKVLRRIVAAVESPAEDDVALEQAIRVARRTGAGLAVAHAEDCSIDLDALRTLIAEPAVEVELQPLGKQGDSALCELVRRSSADLLVIGAHVRTGLKRLLMGSDCERLVRMSPCSVLVARPRSGEEDGFAKILIPTDFSPEADRAVQVATAIAAPGARIHLLHAWQVSAVPGAYYAPVRAVDDVSATVRKPIASSVEQAGADLVARFASDEVEISFHPVEATPRQAIEQWLDDHRCDLVATGSHGRRGFRRLLAGSLAEVTVRKSPCSVLVSHLHGDEESSEAGA